MQSTAQQIYLEPNPIPELKIVEKPLYCVGTQVQGWGRDGSWEAFKDDMSALYACNSRWLGGRFITWELEFWTFSKGMQRKRGGYFDVETGVYFYGGRGELKNA